MFSNNPICITTNLWIINTTCGNESKKKPMRLTVLPANSFLLELVADKDTRKGRILADVFVSWAESHEMSSDSQTSKS